MEQAQTGTWALQVQPYCRLTMTAQPSAKGIAMTFELSDSMIDDIIFSMEDQNGVWLVDAQEGCVFNSESHPSLSPVQIMSIYETDEDRFYEIPAWTSADGFQLLEEFTDNLHTPLAREELRRVITSGRGVFRKFKDVIRAYPEVERKWHFFKAAKMKERIMEWYNTLREHWGLEKLGLEDGELSEDTEDLVCNDFVFREYNSSGDWNDIEREGNLVAAEYTEQFGSELGSALGHTWKHLSSICDAPLKYGFVCHSLSDEFTGCLLVARCPSSSKTAVTLTDFFVAKKYRGLGIGRELLAKSIASLKKLGIKWVLLSNVMTPQALEPLLEQNGFTRIGLGYAADLSKE